MVFGSSRTAVTLGLVAACFLGSFRRALADEPPAPLPIHLTAPSGCPSEDELRSAVRHLLRDPSGSPSGLASVDVAITQSTDGQYALLLDLVDSQGISHLRNLVGGTCGAVVDAAAVAIALASDTESVPKVDQAPLPTPPAPKVAPSPKSAVVPPALSPTRSSATDRAATRRASRYAWDLEAFGGADFASLPTPTPGFGLAAARDVARNQISLGASAWIPERAGLASRSASGAHIGLYVGSLQYGRSLFSGRFDLIPSGGIEVGAIVAKGSGVENAKVGVGPWIAPSLGLTGFVQLTPGFALSLEIEGLVLAARPRFDITSGGQVYEPPPVTARTLLGVHAEFL